MLERIKKSLKKAFIGLAKVTPMILAVIGLVGLFEAYITPEMIKTLFNGNLIHDELIGVTAGAVSIGQPFLSYIIGGELLKDGVSYYALTAFILSFVTLGVIQLPLQVEIFGKKFTIIVNILSLIFSVIVSVATVWTLKVWGFI